MKKIKFSRQGLALFMVMLMFTIIPNMKVYSAMGNYTTTSQGLVANEISDFGDGTDVQNNLLAAAAEAVALAYGCLLYTSDAADE